MELHNTGLGVPLVSAMIATLFEVEDSMLIKISVLAFWTALFGTSVYKGLKAASKFLPTSMLFSLSLRFFLYLSQAWCFILDLTVNSFGLCSAIS